MALASTKCHAPFSSTQRRASSTTAHIHRSYSRQSHTRDVKLLALTPAAEGCERRTLLLGAAALAAVGACPQPSGALTLEEVTPSIAPVGPLTDRETAIINIFENSSLAVGNVFDVTLLGRATSTIPEADVPEGNGSGIVWDADGHVVTNYHVLQSALAKFGAPASAAVSSAPSPAIGKRVGLVTLQLPDGGQQTYDAVLVGADRARGGLRVSLRRRIQLCS
eukprot:GHRQ01038678.1.p1 GENE.GHRQ01038678.1~~GHRQ01038678.1.p1  ORF type:complete len:222 (+),score=55.30 GHRQ01038678.1:112-777(+)